MIPIKVDLNPPAAELIRELNSLEDDLKTKAVRSGLRKAATPIRKHMQAVAPHKYGSLRSSISATTVSARAASRLQLWTRNRGDDKVEAGQVAILIGPNKKVRGRSRARIGALLEFGTRPHVIEAKRGIRKMPLFKNTAVTKVNHPGVKARRWMARSMDANAAQIADRFYGGLAAFLDKNR